MVPIWTQAPSISSEVESQNPRQSKLLIVIARTSTLLRGCSWVDLSPFGEKPVLPNSLPIKTGAKTIQSMRISFFSAVTAVCTVPLLKSSSIWKRRSLADDDGISSAQADFDLKCRSHCHRFGLRSTVPGINLVMRTVITIWSRSRFNQLIEVCLRLPFDRSS